MRRRYVEHETLIKKLYITDIRASDEGTYRCRGARAGFQADKQVTLKLYSEYSRLYNQWLLYFGAHYSSGCAAP